MKAIVLLSATIICLASTSFAQIDTLTANEIGTITLPDSIRTFLTQDLDNDSIKEMILNTGNHLYVYRFGVEQPIWESPELINAADIQFADVNRDSLLDVCVRDSANIWFYDVYHSTVIYFYPVPNLFRCYTIGDINSDGIVDLAIIRQETFEAGDREDSVWTTILYGPDYISQGNFILTMANYYNSDGNNYQSFSQTASRIMLAQVGFADNPIYRIILLSTINSSYRYSHMLLSGSSTYGKFWVINPANFLTIDTRSFAGCDTILPLSNSNGLITIYSILSRGDYLANMGEYYSTRKYWIARFNVSGLIDTVCVLNKTMVWHVYPPCGGIPDWSRIIGEFNPENPNIELCYGYGDSLTEYSILTESRIWAAVAPVDSCAVNGIINSPNLFPSPEIVIKEVGLNPRYYFVNGISHEVSAILQDFIPPFTQIADINADANDEIISVSGNMVHIYSLARITGVSDDITNPGEYFASSNYPNPFNAQTTIKYHLPEKANVKIEIYDITGRKITNLDCGQREAGFNQISWDASDKPSGMYYYRIATGGNSEIGRMILLK